MDMKMTTTTYPGHCSPNGRAPCFDTETTTYSLFANQLNPAQVFDCKSAQVLIPSGVQ